MPPEEKKPDPPKTTDPNNKSQQIQQTPPPKPIDPEKLLIGEMKSRLKDYYAIVLRNIRDSVPKIIGHFFVKSVQVKFKATK